MIKEANKESDNYSEEERDKVPQVEMNRQLEEQSNRGNEEGGTFTPVDESEDKVNIDETQMLDIAEYIFNTIA